MKHIFGLSMFATKDNEVSITTGLCSASSQEEAAGIAQKLANKMYAGYDNPTGMASNPDMYITVDNVDDVIWK